MRGIVWAAVGSLSMLLMACSGGRTEMVGGSKTLEPVRADAWTSVPLSDPRLVWTGRITGERPLFAWTGTRLELRFRGSGIRLRFRSLQDGGMDPTGRNYYELSLDGKDTSSHAVSAGEPAITLEHLENTTHSVLLEKATEAQCGRDELVSVEVLGELKEPATTARSDRAILFLGNSITAGYGIEDEDPSRSFRAETQNGGVAYAAVAAGILGASRTQICISGRGMVRNFDGATDALVPAFAFWTEPQDHTPWPGKERADVVVVEAGTNDFALGDPGELPFVLAYQRFVREIMEHFPKAKVVLTDSPMLTDEWPVDPHTKRPVPSASLLQGYLAQVRGGLQPSEKARLSVFHFTPQAQDLYGYGADYHPNRAQARCNGEELAEHIRKVAGW